MAVAEAALELMTEIHLFEGGPRTAVEGSLAVGLLTEEQAEVAGQVLKDRNVTAHVYGMDRVDEVRARIPGYAELLRVWLDAIEQDYAKWTGDSAQSTQN